MIIIDTTQPKTQNNLKQTGDDYNYGISIQTRNLMFNPTTYIMEDDFIFFENGRLPQFFRKCKMTSFFWKSKPKFVFFENVLQPKFLKMEDNLKFRWNLKMTSIILENWRRLFFLNLRRPKFFLLERWLTLLWNGGRPAIFFNGRRNQTFYTK